MRELKGDWRDLFNGFMLALDLRKMFLGFVGLSLSLVLVGLYMTGWDRFDPLILRDPRVLRLDRPAWQLQPRFEKMFHPKTVMLDEPSGLTCEGICLSLNATASRVVHHPNWPVRFLLPVGLGLILTLIWSYFGGAIARIAAVEVARDERLEVQKALHFAHKKYGAFFWSALVCLIGFLFFAACNVVGGLVGWLLNFGGHFHLGVLLVAIGLPLAILSGFIMALILIGSVLGSVLFYPAVGAEGTDSFDAISRGFSYVYSRPWHYALYQVVSAAYGAICVAFVWWFGKLMLVLGLGAGRLGLGTDGHGRHLFDRMLPESVTLSLFHGGDGYSSAPGNTFGDLGRFQTVGAIVVGAWLVLVLGMLAGYAVSYFFSSQTLTYFLLRKKVDGIEMNEVYEEKEEELKPEGAPVAAADAAAAPAAGSAGQPPGSGGAK